MGEGKEEHLHRTGNAEVKANARGRALQFELFLCFSDAIAVKKAEMKFSIKSLFNLRIEADRRFS